jgi:enamine deaminase RidA (YjgF/YER057c/UK114 family)
MMARIDGAGSRPRKSQDQGPCIIEGERMSSIERLEIGPRMSQAVIHNGVVYLAGQVADDAVGASVATQTENILKKIDALLKAAGSDKSKLLSARVWLTDMRKFDEMNKVWDAWVVPGQTPTRVCVEAKLAAPEYTVEILVIAGR